MLRASWILIVTAFVSCASNEESQDVAPTSIGPLVVYTVNYPLQYFADKIGGEHVETVFPAPADSDPAEWSPQADDILGYQGADLILLNGATYAKWIDRVTLPASKLVDTSVSFQDRYIVIEDTVVHSHGPEGEHSHGETAFTTWLDPTLAIEHAKAIRDALAAARPEHEASFEQGLAALEQDLKALDERMERAAAAKAGEPLIASHPVYQYLARRYRLNLPAVHFEPHAFPDQEAWQELALMLEGHVAKAMLWEAEPANETAQRLRDMGVASVVFDPCANRPDAGDYLSVMEANVARFEELLSGS